MELRMADTINPAALHHLPRFITPPGETDVLMVVTGILLLLGIVAFGILFFKLHTLPERLAHKSQKIQFEIVAVLGLIALFTHMHIFWVIGLLLALIDLPDFGTMMSRIARSVEKMAGIKSTEPAAEGPSEITPDVKRARDAIGTHPQRHDRDRAVAGIKSESTPASQKETSHA
jgi:hypothetical protein